MIEKLITLFKIGRAFAKSDALSYFEEIYDPPWIVKLLVKILGFSFSEKKVSSEIPANEKLTYALKKLGPTFIKLGQFLGTRPDIVGEVLAKDLQKLQDRMEPISLNISTLSFET